MIFHVYVLGLFITIFLSLDRQKFYKFTETAETAEWTTNPKYNDTAERYTKVRNFTNTNIRTKTAMQVGHGGFIFQAMVLDRKLE